MREKGGVLMIRLGKIKIYPEHSDEYMGIHPGDYLRITVSDTGVGMSDKVKEQIFSPYFTTRNIGEGSGLGLSVVYGIVQEYKGAIRFQSKPDNGTTFEVLLPSLYSAESPSKADDMSPAPKGKEHILLVDDEEMITNMLKQMLEKLSYHVITQSDSLKSLDIFCENPEGIDLVITDMTMPKMSGLELAASLKRIREDIPIILCTGYSEVITEEKMKASGISQLLMKPVSKKRLAETIRQIFEK
jgi:CheY-like chemotaxis protein